MKKSIQLCCAAFLLAIGLVFLSPKQALADNDFSVSLVSTYNVTADGSTFVEEKFQLTNNTPTYYAKDYSLDFASSKLSNIRVTDAQGEIPSEITTAENKTTVHINFKDTIVGEGKGRTFTVSFSNPDSAQISGKILEVDVPKLLNAGDYSNYQVIVKTPIVFGDPVRVTPNSFQLSKDSKNTSVSLDNLGDQSVSILFGNKQVFDFTVVNNVENPTSNIGVVQLALPPDTARQKVDYISLDPQPKEMTRDADGNWIATYEIAAEKSLNVSLAGKVFLSLEDSQDLYLPPPDHQWTDPQKYWESNNYQVVQLAKQYKTPREIYDYVVNHLTYNYGREESTTNDRLGSLGIIATPADAVCQEFTDLFIAMARANNIPARRAVGYAFTANSRLRPLGFIQDTLHTWPEYYDNTTGKWIPVDPTWGNTTGGINYFDQFDFNHVVFSINGQSSTLPYAAGSYRKERQITNNIDVKFGNDLALPAPTFHFDLNRNSFWNSPLNPQFTLKITNQTGVAWYNIPIEVRSDNQSVQVSTSLAHLDYLLPYQTREITIGTSTSQKLKAHPFTLTVLVDGLSSTYELNTAISFQGAFNPNIIAVGLVGCVVIVATLAWSILVSRRSRYRALRRKSQGSQK